MYRLVLQWGASRFRMAAAAVLDGTLRWSLKDCYNINPELEIKGRRKCRCGLNRKDRFAVLSDFALLSRNGLVSHNIHWQSLHVGKFWHFGCIDQVLGSVSSFPFCKAVFISLRSMFMLRCCIVMVHPTSVTPCSYLMLLRVCGLVVVFLNRLEGDLTEAPRRN